MLLILSDILNIYFPASKNSPEKESNMDKNGNILDVKLCKETTVTDVRYKNNNNSLIHNPCQSTTLIINRFFNILNNIFSLELKSCILMKLAYSSFKGMIYIFIYMHLCVCVTQVCKCLCFQRHYYTSMTPNILNIFKI